MDMSNLDLLTHSRNLLNGLEKQRDNIIAALSFTGGTHTFNDIVHMVVSGRLTFWELENSFFISEFIEYPRQKHLHVFLAGGKFSEIIAMQDRMKSYAAFNGCNKITISGRPGSTRRLPNFGWSHQHTTMALDLGDPKWQAAAEKVEPKPQQ